MAVFRKLYLLIWKNLMIRKHHICYTVAEIVVPILAILALLICYIIGLRLIRNRPRELNNGPERDYNQHKWEYDMGDVLITSAKIKCYRKHQTDSDREYELVPDTSCIIAYTPLPSISSTVSTESILQKLIEASDKGVQWKLYENVAEIEKQTLFDGVADKRKSKESVIKYAQRQNEEFGDLEKEIVNWNDIEFAVVFENLELNNIVYKILPNHDASFNCPDRRTDLELMEAFAILQWNIDQILIEAFAGKKPSISNEFQNVTTECKVPEDDYVNRGIKLDVHLDIERRKVKETDTQNILLITKNIVLSLVGMLISLSNFLIVLPTIRLVIGERDSGIKELMKLFGISNWMHWTCFMINSIMFPVICSIVITGFLCINFTGITNGAIIANNTDVVTIFFILFLYLIAGAAFCFFIATVCVKYFIALIVGFMAWWITSLSYIAVLSGMVGFGGKMLLALFPNLALCFSFEVVQTLTYYGEGVNVLTVAKSLPNPYAMMRYRRRPLTEDQNETNLTLLHMIGMLILDIVLYSGLTLYLDAIIPTEFTVAKPFYFIFDPATYGITFKKKNLLEPLTEESNYGPNFEPEPEGLKVGAEIKNLRKVFGFGRGKVAVDGISLKMYEGQIFTLLGHNGAGKTTTISCCIGMTSPTSGTAIINGFDIRNQMDQVRQNLGVCNQHNVLFDDLTVDEHLIFFGQLKGVSGKAAKEERTAMLQNLQLIDKANTMSKKLSGGQKRKLSLGLALIGKAKVVFLDEPTSGMDVEARRGIWDLLQFERTNRTIILTTHFMEEAEILGDRIGIMSHGKLQCCGTPTFLKTYYGEGYRLIVTTTDGSPKIKEAILEIVQYHISTAFIEPSVLYSGAVEFSISVPKEGFSKSILPSMFKSLNEKKEQYNIVSFEFTQSTLDDVFVKAAELQVGSHPLPGVTTQAIGTESTTASESTYATTAEGPSKVELLESAPPKQLRVKGMQLFFKQFSGILMKRLLYTSKKFGLLIVPLLLYLVIFVCSVKFLIGNPNSNQALVHNRSEILDQTRGKERFIAAGKKNMLYFVPPGTNDTFLKSFFASISLIDRDVFLFNTENPLLDLEFIDMAKNKYTIAVKLNPTSMKVFWSTYVRDSGALAVNIMSNTLLKFMTKNDNANITVKTQPLSYPQFTVKELAFWRNELIGSKKTIQIYAMGMTLLGYGFMIFVVMFIIPPIEERICQAKQLQLMTGVNPIIYWGASYLWDLCLFSIIAIIAVITLKLSEEGEVYSRNWGIIIYFIILMAFGNATIPFIYLWSMIPKSPIKGLGFIITFYVVFDISFCLGIRIGELKVTTDNPSTSYLVYNLVKFLLRFSPLFSFQVMNKSFFELAYVNEEYSSVDDKIKDSICFNDPGCENCRNLNDCDQIPLLSWSYTSKAVDIFGFPAVDEDIHIITPGIGQELLYSILYGTFYHILLCLIELGLIAKWKNAICKQPLTEFQSAPNEEDVQTEAERVHELVGQRRTNEDALVITDLCKSYKGFSAVANLSFGVHHGECFGLLGVNGAGKTTTFRILTGDETRSFGEAYASNLRLTVERNQFLSKFGYCPQFDGIVGVLTGRQMVQLFARLRGVKNVDEACKAMLAHVGLTESANVQCRKYSGGMKRRLSAAMGAIGDPEILLLDEPTTGVDPVSRREFWKIIKQAKAAGRSIILTSHSMDEIEACCSRLGIMVNGQLQCIGSIQHLKHKYAQGYRLTINWKPNAITENSARVAELEQRILHRFEPCIIKDKHQMQVQYHIQNPNLSYDFLFETMERLAHEVSDVMENYDITKTTLEEIFLSFAKAQYPPRVSGSGGGGCCCCSSNKKPPKVAPIPNVIMVNSPDQVAPHPNALAHEPEQNALIPPAAAVTEGRSKGSRSKHKHKHRDPNPMDYSSAPDPNAFLSEYGENDRLSPVASVISTKSSSSRHHRHKHKHSKSSKH